MDENGEPTEEAREQYFLYRLLRERKEQYKLENGLLQFKLHGKENFVWLIPRKMTKLFIKSVHEAKGTAHLGRDRT